MGMRRVFLLSVVVAMAVAVPWSGCATSGSTVSDRDEADEAGRCTTDLECSPGDQCIRPRGEIYGICGRLVDQYGAPTTGIRRSADPCQNDFDCPVMFRCERTTPSGTGICVKQ